MTTIDRSQLEQWVAAYERLWRTPGTDTLGELFTDDATYSMEPYGEPFRGLAAIAALWERERESAEEAFTMMHEIVACDGDTAVVRVEVFYDREPREQFRDLWIARFTEGGRCFHFEEWPFWPSKI